VTVPKEKTEKNLDNYFFNCKFRTIKLSFLNLKKVGVMNSKQAGGISTDKLTPTMEDYLEAIYNLSQEKRVVRVKDIAKRLG